MTQSLIQRRLHKLEKDLSELKQQFYDSILDEDDLKAIAEFEKEKKEGKLISHEQLMRELGVRVKRRVR